MSRRHIAIGLMVISSLALALRVYHLGAKSLWLDEAVIYEIAQGSPNDVIEKNARYNSAPPLFALLTSVVVRFGTSEAALRCLSVVAGTIAVPATYLLARQFGTPLAGLLAAFLVAVAPHQIRYSQQVREYALAFLLANLLPVAWIALQRRPSLRTGVGVGALVAAAVFTQYGLALLVLGLNIAFVASLRGTAAPRKAVVWSGVANAIGAAAVAAVYVLALREQFVVGGRGAATAGDYLTSGYWDGTAWSAGRLLIKNTYDLVLFALPSDATVLACGLGLVALASARAWKSLFWLAAPVAVAVGAALLRAYPYLGERQALFLTPVVYVCAALGIQWSWRLTRHIALPGLLALMLIGRSLSHAGQYLQHPGQEHLKPIVEFLLSHANSGDGVYVYHASHPAFRYYTRHAALEWTAGLFRPGDLDGYRPQIEALVATRRPVWLVFSHTDPTEMAAILDAASEGGPTALVRQEPGAWLFVTR